MSYGGYPPQGGYGGYPPQGGYGGYPQQGAYPQQPAYPPQPGYPPQGGYGGYPQPGAYPQQPGYAQPPAYMPPVGNYPTLETYGMNIAQNLIDQDCQMLRMAFLTDKISVIEKEMGKREETGNNTSLVLAKLIKQIQAPLSLLDKMLTKIDQLCNGRYNWLQVRDNMIKGIPDNRTDMLEQFLARK